MLDVTNFKLHVFQESTQEGYDSKVIFTADAIVASLQFPALAIASRNFTVAIAFNFRICL
ncbi:hypothetical protein FNW02_19730 [Komarekiella sp. 'clone 1']|uniref:Uncharacterized protein n=1 Tax=Komarekiella delphini-convector SJRDD-AB1 TaxID=2593771 RepID=A0AA40SZN5_9NOST|nr:hypothetical protein [Komarekiella delphini-convector]MBD6617994.1 hypothetical protein [Komarekiella delphini-convector SJRDD-AB1]